MNFEKTLSDQNEKHAGWKVFFCIWGKWIQIFCNIKHFL